MTTIETVLTRMMNEPAFADAVFTDAAAALADYQLSAEELANIKAMSRAGFENMTPEDRKSFGVIIWD